MVVKWIGRIGINKNLWRKLLSLQCITRFSGRSKACAVANKTSRYKIAAAPTTKYINKHIYIYLYTHSKPISFHRITLIFVLYTAPARVSAYILSLTFSRFLTKLSVISHFIYILYRIFIYTHDFLTFYLLFIYFVCFFPSFFFGRGGVLF